MQCCDKRESKYKLSDNTKNFIKEVVELSFKDIEAGVSRDDNISNLVKLLKKHGHEASDEKLADALRKNATALQPVIENFLSIVEENATSVSTTDATPKTQDTIQK